jgi:glycosyltransferase involved in cell wall biosynthesis
MSEGPRVLIAAEHASARFGGEAALPLHYFRVLRRRGVPVWLLTHARTRVELSGLYPGDDHIHFIEDTGFHRTMWRIGQRLPDPIAYATTGFLSRVSTQLAQRRLARRLVREHGITVVHQPMPVSPREPSTLHGLGAPVLIGPMNGGMDYPPAFRRHRGIAERVLYAVGRASATVLNRLMPGKRRAATLIVANRRTREALPAGPGHRGRRARGERRRPEPVAGARHPAEHAADATTTFVYMGRLVDWKAVDLVVQAFAQARTKVPMRLWILGDGSERGRLEALAVALGLPHDPVLPGAIHFAGWLPQAECAARLHEADALVLPSLLECGGAVVLEAMSLAKPVIATAWGGPLDYLDADCGLLVEPRSREAIVEGFAAAMLELAGSPALRRRLGARGLERVRREFDWEIKVDRMLDLYSKCLGRQPVGAVAEPESGGHQSLVARKRPSDDRRPTADEGER